MRSYNPYEYKLVERQIASAVARKLGSLVSEDQREEIVKANETLNSAKNRLRDLTDQIVNELLYLNRNSSARAEYETIS